MSKGQWLLVSCGLLAVAFLLYFALDDAEPPSVDPERPGARNGLLEADGEDEEHAARLKGAGIKPVEAPPPEPPPPPVDLRIADRERDLHGVVVREDDTPVAGAELQVVYYPWRYGRLLTDGQYEVERLGPSSRSSTDGTFSLPLQRGDHVHLRVTAAGMAPAEYAMLQAGEFVRVVLHLPVRLIVEARTPEGEPAPGLELEASRGSSEGTGFRRTGTTDAAGRCVFDNLPPGGSAYLDAMPREEGWGDPPVIFVPLPRSGETTYELKLPKGRTLRGAVIDKVTGEPISRARVGMGWTLDHHTRTDADGRYVLAGWSGQGIQSLHVLAEGYGREQVDVGAKERLDFELMPGVSAEGRVLGPEGKPFEGAQVMVVGDSREGGVERLSMDHAWTDEQGRFLLNGLRRDLEHVLTIIARGHAQHLGDIAAQPDGDAVDLGDVVLQPGRTLFGTLRGKDAAPLPRILINLRIVEPGKQGYRRGRAWERTTDDLGRFRFQDLPPGAYTVATRPEGGAGISQRVKVLDRDEPTEVKLVQALGRGVRIRVTSADGLPVADALLVAQVPGSDRVQAQTGADGLAVLRLPPAPVSVQLVFFGESPYAQPESITITADQTEAAFVLKPAATTTGTLFDPAGSPLARASIEAQRDGKSVAWARTDEEGRFKISTEAGIVFTIAFRGRIRNENGNAGFTTLAMEAHREGVRAGSKGVVLRAQALEGGASLRVRVLDPGGKPVEDAYVFLSPSPRASGAQRTDADGRVAFEALVARRTWVRVTSKTSSKRPWLMPEPQAVMPEGQELVLWMRKGIVIEGSVIRADDTLAVNVAVSAEIGGKAVSHAGTDRDGRFAIVVDPETTQTVTLRCVDRAKDGTTYTAVAEDVRPGGTSIVLRLQAAE